MNESEGWERKRGKTQSGGGGGGEGVGGVEEARLEPLALIGRRPLAGDAVRRDGRTDATQ